MDFKELLDSQIKNIRENETQRQNSAESRYRAEMKLEDKRRENAKKDWKLKINSTRLAEALDKYELKIETAEKEAEKILEKPMPETEDECIKQLSIAVYRCNDPIRDCVNFTQLGNDIEDDEVSDMLKSLDLKKPDKIKHEAWYERAKRIIEICNVKYPDNTDTKRLIKKFRTDNLLIKRFYKFHRTAFYTTIGVIAFVCLYIVLGVSISYDNQHYQETLQAANDDNIEKLVALSEEYGFIKNFNSQAKQIDDLMGGDIEETKYGEIILQIARKRKANGVTENKIWDDIVPITTPNREKVIERLNEHL